MRSNNISDVCVFKYDVISTVHSEMELGRFLFCFSYGRMQFTFGVTCSTTMSFSIRTDWTPTEYREKHRLVHLPDVTGGFSAVITVG